MLCDSKKLRSSRSRQLRRARGPRQPDHLPQVKVAIPYRSRWRRLLGNPESSASRVVARVAGASEFRDFLGEPIETGQPLVFFLCETAIRDSFCGRRLGVWLGREDCIIAIEPPLRAVVDFETRLQLLGNRQVLRLGGDIPRLDLDQRLSSDGRWFTRTRGGAFRRCGPLSGCGGGIHD